MIYIFWTCRDKQEAKKIIHALLDQRLGHSGDIPQFHFLKVNGQKSFSYIRFQKNRDGVWI